MDAEAALREFLDQFNVQSHARVPLTHLLTDENGNTTNYAIPNSRKEELRQSMLQYYDEYAAEQAIKDLIGEEMPPPVLFGEMYCMELQELSPWFRSLVFMLTVHSAKKNEAYNYIPWGSRLYRGKIKNLSGCYIQNSRMQIFNYYYKEALNYTRHQINNQYVFKSNWRSLGLPAVNQIASKEFACHRPFVDFDMKQHEWEKFQQDTNNSISIEELHNTLINIAHNHVKTLCSDEDAVFYIAKSNANPRNLHIVFHACLARTAVKPFIEDLRSLVTRQLPALPEKCIDTQPLLNHNLRPIGAAKADQDLNAQEPSVYLPTSVIEENREFTMEDIRNYSILCPCSDINYDTARTPQIGYVDRRLNTNTGTYEAVLETRNEINVVKTELTRLYQAYRQQFGLETLVNAQSIEPTQISETGRGFNYRVNLGKIICPWKGSVHKGNRLYAIVNDKGAFIRCHDSDHEKRDWPEDHTASEQLVRYLGSVNQRKRKLGPIGTEEQLQALGAKNSELEYQWKLMDLEYSEQLRDKFRELFVVCNSPKIQPQDIVAFCREPYNRVYRVHTKERRVYAMCRIKHQYAPMTYIPEACDIILKFFIHNLVYHDHRYLEEHPDVEQFLTQYRCREVSNALKEADKRLSEQCAQCTGMVNYVPFETVQNAKRNLVCLEGIGILDFSPDKLVLGTNGRLQPELRDIRPDDYVTMGLTLDEYIPLDAELTQEQEEKVAWVHRLLLQFGCMSEAWKTTLLDRVASSFDPNRTSNPMINILVGIGSNGKTTFQDLMMKTFGSTIKTVPNTLLSSKGVAPNAPSPATCDLHHLRAWFLSEPDGDSHYLNESTIKLFAGGETLTARKMYGTEMINIVADGVPWFLCNTAPKVHGVDEGVWRRLLYFSCNARFKPRNDPDVLDPERDDVFPQIEDIKDKLDRHRGAFFYIVMQHWYECFGKPGATGVRIAPEIKKFNDELKSRANPLFIFINEHLEPCRPNKSLTLKQIYREFSDWVMQETREKTNIDMTQLEGVLNVNRLALKSEMRAFWKPTSKFHPDFVNPVDNEPY